MKVEIEELIPYLDERPLTGELLVELGFEKVVSVDSVDNSSYTYYVYHHESDNVPSLYADLDEKWVVRLTHYDHITESPYWDTYGSVKMLMICLLGDNENPIK